MALPESVLKEKIIARIIGGKGKKLNFDDLSCPYGHSDLHFSCVRGGGLPASYRVWCSGPRCSWEFRHTESSVK